jgi:hypothetical protein
MTERLHQFHFQTFVSLLPEIVASLQDEHAKSQFTSIRGQKFQGFCATMEGHLEAALAAILHDDEPEPWFEASRSSPPKGDDPALGPLFKAYRQLRIEHQKSYADFKIRDDGRIFSNSARRQSSVLEGVGFSSIVLLLAIHIVVGAAILIGWLAGAPLAHVLIPLLNAAIMWIAIVALAARTFEQGLQSESEIERYQQYGSACKAILERFDAAPSQADKVRVMAEMERLSFDEMRDFLIMNQRARFVM